MCVGMYFPVIGTIKGEVVAEDTRSAVYNLFRVPLNVIVLTVLLSNVSVQGALLCSSLMLAAATGLAFGLQRHTASSVISSSGAGELGLLQEDGADDGRM